eukprot:3315841-Rhodomonas_salina.5
MWCRTCARKERSKRFASAPPRSSYLLAYLRTGHRVPTGEDAGQWYTLAAKGRRRGTETSASRVAPTGSDSTARAPSVPRSDHVPRWKEVT